MHISLQNKKALVCGSTQGIGLATATLMAKMGASITLVARNQEKLKQIQRELDQSNGQSHKILVADFSDPSSLESALSSLNDVHHILVNNTGGPAGGPANLAKTDEFSAAFSMHLICNHILVQAVLPGMKEAGYGRIVNVISTSVKQPLDNLGVSNTIRGAVANWSKTLANELGSFGITVNNVLPGATATQRLHSIIENKAKKLNATYYSVAQKMISSIPANRFGEAVEIAHAIAFLSSPLASYINGINLPVDGGRTKSL